MRHQKSTSRDTAAIDTQGLSLKVSFLSKFELHITFPLFVVEL